MIEIAFNLLAVLISVYWVGEKTRKNPRIDAFLSAIEGNYSRLNSRLEDATIVSGLRFLRQFYGWASIFLFACLFVFQRFSQPSPKNFLSLFWVCGFAFIGWFSIKWVTEHKNTINEFSKNNALIIFGPLLMSIFDLIFHTSFTEILLISFQQAAAVLHFNMPDTSNPLAIGGAVSLVLFGFFCFYYLLAWAVAVPVFMFSVFAVVLPIRFARALAQIDRNNTFFWFTVFVMSVISLLQTQL
ncbi:hypothetical protein [Kerstersia gyiorum]|uniref:hypothetical protein n=1 Tax=Kerstersia gyiorum TaxID=206506 RepID=UPI00209E14C9|nr:hypothetical protein [Kerstersia gyiorum]MCP1680288.1 hypothetical protein [Kerstersia gyiorum]MCP1824704.1 hypothetical protein [Kerstersia gyiorum]MCP1828231.1 hypothetical protein [Kerstersia gyiorum]MCW2451864.1 hypothetical protein [Kerstersia gyiorum]